MAGEPLADFVYLDSMRGQELLRFKVPSFAERDKRDITPETACPCPQIYFDPILGNHARTLPSVTLRYNTRLDSFRHDADGVSVEITDMASGAARDAARAVSRRLRRAVRHRARRARHRHRGHRRDLAQRQPVLPLRRARRRRTTRAGRASTA